MGLVEVPQGRDEAEGAGSGEATVATRPAALHSPPLLAGCGQGWRGSPVVSPRVRGGGTLNPTSNQTPPDPDSHPEGGARSGVGWVEGGHRPRWFGLPAARPPPWASAVSAIARAPRRSATIPSTRRQYVAESSSPSAAGRHRRGGGRPAWKEWDGEAAFKCWEGQGWTLARWQGGCVHGRQRGPMTPRP